MGWRKLTSADDILGQLAGRDAGGQPACSAQRGHGDLGGSNASQELSLGAWVRRAELARVERAVLSRRSVGTAVLRKIPAAHDDGSASEHGGELISVELHFLSADALLPPARPAPFAPGMASVPA